MADGKKHLPAVAGATVLIEQAMIAAEQVTKHYDQL
jgi:hypothetical protein